MELSKKDICDELMNYLVKYDIHKSPHYVKLVFLAHVEISNCRQKLDAFERELPKLTKRIINNYAYTLGNIVDEKDEKIE